MSLPTYLDKLLVNLTQDDCPVCVESFLGFPDLPPDPDREGLSLGIALLPCGHAYHDACLKQWLPQANSCPICRTKFNQVEILDKVGGALASTYEVEDKTQVAEFDAATWAAENPEGAEDELELDLCPVCELYDTQDVVVVCDGCDGCYHPICAGLDAIPAEDWYCPTCLTGQIHLSVSPRRWAASPTPGSPPRTHDRVREAHRRRPRAEEHRRNEQRGRSRAEQNRLGWTNVSNRIHAAAGLELDFLDDDPSMETFRRLQNRASEERRELLDWEERLNSANRRIARGVLGSARRHPSPVTNNIPTAGTAGEARSRHNSVSHQPSTTRAVREAVSADERPRRTPAVRERSAPSSPEQIIAWGDFDRAQHLDAATPGSRKRKADSSVGSPVEPSEPQEPERKLKRPRTRAVLDNGPSSSTPSSSHTPYRPAINTDSGPSFLASLLREVESATGEERFPWSPSISIQEPATSPSNYHTSPATSPSPVSSTYHTPRALSLTPPPQHTTRTTSAQSMSSRTRSPAPIFVRRHGIESTSPTLEIRQPRPRRREEFVGPRSVETSPVRATMPIEAKESINKIVKTVLSPHWRSAKLNKDQYADINRDVSRKMYEIVADDYANIERDRQTWEKIAAREVAAAVNALAA